MLEPTETTLEVVGPFFGQMQVDGFVDAYQGLQKVLSRTVAFVVMLGAKVSTRQVDFVVMPVGRVSAGHTVVVV